MGELMNFFDYAHDKLHVKLKIFEKGVATKEEWDLLVDILAKWDDE